MTELASALAVLSAMITPAVLILACSSLIVATSGRLGRVVDRTRALSERFEALAHDESGMELLEERRTQLFHQLDRSTLRARLLQRAMTRLYLALSVFLATSVAIGVAAAIGKGSGLVLIVLGFTGVGLLFYASVLLIAESRVALTAIDREMDFVRFLVDHHAPSQLVEQRGKRRPMFRRSGP